MALKTRRYIGEKRFTRNI